MFTSVVLMCEVVESGLRHLTMNMLEDEKGEAILRWFVVVLGLVVYCMTTYSQSETAPRV